MKSFSVPLTRLAVAAIIGLQVGTVQAAPINGMGVGLPGVVPGLPVIPGMPSIHVPGVNIPGIGSGGLNGAFVDPNGNAYIQTVVNSDPAHYLYYVVRVPVGPRGTYGQPQPGFVYAPPGQLPVAYSLPYGPPAYGPQGPYGNQNMGAGGPGGWPDYGYGNGPINPAGGGYGPAGDGSGAYGQGVPGGYTNGPQFPPSIGGSSTGNAQPGQPGQSPGGGAGSSSQAVSGIPADAQQAIVDLQEAWTTGKPQLLQEHLTNNGMIRLYYNGKYDHSVQGNQYLELARKAIAGMSTQSFVLNHRAQLSDGRVQAWGQHVFYDEARNRRVTSACFWLQPVGSQWIVTAVNSANDPKNVLVTPAPAG